MYLFYKSSMNVIYIKRNLIVIYYRRKYGYGGFTTP